MRLPRPFFLFILLFTALAACDEPPAPSAGTAGAKAPCRSGCDAPIEPRPGPTPRDERPGASGSPPPLDLAPLIAFTAAGDLAVIDAASGAILASAPGGGLGGLCDIALDPWGNRVVVFESDEEGSGGEITFYPVKAQEIGPRAHVAWVDGRARVAAAPLGIVVFEESYGTRWKMFWRDGSPTISVAAPRPASAWIETADSAAFALTYGDGTAAPAPDRRRAVIQPGSFGPPVVVPINTAFSSLPPTARLVRAPALGGDVLVDRGSGEMTLALLSSAGAVIGSASVDALGAGGRIEAALALEGGRVIVALTSNAPRLVAVRLGDGLEVLGAAAIDLEAPVRVEDLFFSRDLHVIAPRRVLAATAAGVIAIDVIEDTFGVTLVRDPSFDGSGLRGPLDGPPPPP